MPLNPIGRKSPLLCLKVLSHYARRQAQWERVFSLSVLLMHWSITANDSKVAKFSVI